MEIREGVNDFSIIKSGRLNKTWLMLGPISFVNASCDANIEYSWKGFSIQAVVKRDIVVGEELSVFYDKHFFGEFNVDCLCPFIEKHGNPFPEISKPKRRKQVNINHQTVESTPKVPHTRIVRDYFSVKDPIHRFGYINLMESESSDSESETVRDYATVFGTFDRDAFEDVSSIQGDELLNGTLVSLDSPRDISDEFVSDSANVEIEKDPEDFSSIGSFPLFDGSDHTDVDFAKDFESFCLSNTLSNKARQELKLLFQSYLPKPNRVFHSKPVINNASCSVFNFEQSTLIVLDAKSQLISIIQRNFSHIRNSWSTENNFASPNHPFQHGEVQLILNFDGAPIFKSRKLSVWPFWLQCHNLPPKLKSSFHNITLLALWYGVSKPKWPEVLHKVRFELESLSGQTHDVFAVPIRFVFVFIVCDMPAKAAALNMMQFNGFNGCTNCLLIGRRLGSRHIYPCDSPLKLRTCETFTKHAKKAVSKGEPVAGIEGISHLSMCFSFPDSAPIDAMHQVFLGTGKFLCKTFISKIRGKEIEKFNSLLRQCLVPSDFLRKPKTTNEMNFWKAADFKLLFFHLIPLMMQDLTTLSDELNKSFWNLSLAVRLLSLKFVQRKDVDAASRLMNTFFGTFRHLYGEEMQSYNFHSMRHLCDQVLRIGPLWVCSAFAFESANHSLLRTLRGTIKRPMRIVEIFLRIQKDSPNNGATHLTNETNFAALTSVPDVCRKFCMRFGNTYSFSGRWKNPEGLVFNSLSYTRLNDNWANAVVWTKELAFYRLEVFAVYSKRTIAVVRQFSLNKSFSICPTDDVSVNQVFLIGELSELETLNVAKISGKCVLKPNLDNTFLASIVSEGFEHN